MGPAGLHNGDVLSIGSFSLVFSDAASSRQAPAAATQIDPQQTMVHLVLRDITVLVVDIRDFMGLTRGLGAERIAEVIGAFNRETGDIFEAAGTWAVKYIGDAVMAVWAPPDNAGLELLRTVLETLVAIHDLAARYQTRYNLPKPLLIGAGVNMGRASIGNLGGGATSDYTALGDVVNKAFRLESATRTLNADLAFGDEIRERLGSLLTDGLACVSQIQLKGYAEACNVYTMQAACVPQLLAAFA